MDVILDSLIRRLRRASIEMRSLAAFVRAGAFGLERPQRMLQIIKALRDYGPLGSAPRIAAIQHGGHTAISDERGELTFASLEEQVNRLANALCAQDLGPGSSVGILCRNHRDPLIVAFAASRACMNVIWLNTAFSARQLRDVALREGVDLLVYDRDFAEVVAGFMAPKGAITTGQKLETLIATGAPTPPPAPARPGKLVLLTSGTTGTPKGAPRTESRSLSVPGALLQRIPLRAHETTIIGPPLYHGTGLMVALLSIALGSKLVLRSKFSPEQFLADTAAHDASAWCVVPIMLQRILALDPEQIAMHDTSSLRVVLCAGSQLPADVARRSTDTFGEVVYNLYGSTEVSVATLATPADVQAAPASVGRPALGARINLLDEHGNEVARGRSGRIFVGTMSPFEGYTGGGAKEVVDGLMSTGDIGHFDTAGRLFIDGRDDEMIVSGGENVFPREVEELLITHPAIADAAALGVEDAEFGQRLIAFVVLHAGEAATAEDIQAFVKDNLARYKVPREVGFLDELPRNPTGKVLKRELAPRSQSV